MRQHNKNTKIIAVFRKGCSHLKSQRGVALVMAMIASLILIALALLVISFSTQDLRTSVQVVGDKRAMAAAEKGIHRLTQNFDPQNLAASAGSTWAEDLAVDAQSLYTIGTPTVPTVGPVFIPMVGYSIGGGQTWGQRRYIVDVRGQNTKYNTTATISVGVGYGPIEISTMSR
jgi:hypothetical protein